MAWGTVHCAVIRTHASLLTDFSTQNLFSHENRFAVKISDAGMIQHHRVLELHQDGVPSTGPCAVLLAVLRPCQAAGHPR